MFDNYPKKFFRECEMIIENGKLTLKAGQQWTSPIFNAQRGSIALLEINSTQRVYWRLISLSTYNSLTLNQSKYLDFPFGSDRSQVYEPLLIGADLELLLVLRLSVFNESAEIMINLELIGPPKL